MGVIFAMERDGVVYVAADAVKPCCSVNFYVNEEPNLRVRRMPNGIIVASSGPMKLSQHMWLRDEWFTLEEGERFDKRFIVTKIIPRFYEATRHLDEWEEAGHNSFVYEMNGGFIIARGADIYVVFSDLSVVRCGGLAALSDGAADITILNYANACRDGSPEEVIRRAYAFTAARTANVFTHGYIINTRDLTYQRMEDIPCS